MNENEKFRQSASAAAIVKLDANEYVATIRSANLNGVTCEIEAIFPHGYSAVAWVMSFGFSDYVYRELLD